MAENKVDIKVTVDGAQAKQGLGEVESELGRVGGKQTEVAQTSVQAGGLINETSHKIKGGIQSISERLDAARTQLLAFMGVQQGLAGIKQVLDMADGYRDLEARIRLVVGEGADLASAMERVRQVALATNTGLDETGQLFTRITRLGKDAGMSTQEAVLQAQALTQTISQAVQLGGAGMEESRAAISQFVLGLQQGDLSGRGLNATLKQAPGLARALADGLGVTTAELVRMSDAGQLSSSAVIAALQKQGDAVQAQYDKLPQTVGQAMTNLRTAFTGYIAEQDKANGYTTKTTEVIGLLARNLDSVANALLHAGQSFGAWKALNMAQSWVAAKLAIEQETTATTVNTTAKVANARASAQAAAATGAHAAAASQNATAQAAASAANVAGAAAAGKFSAVIGGLGVAARVAAKALAPLALIDFALNFKTYGQWIGETAAKLMGYKDRSAELAEQEKLNAKIAEQAAADRLALARATQEAIDKQFELGKAAGQALAQFDQLTKDGRSAAEAVGEITKGFDLGKLQGINDFAATLDKLAADGKVNAGEFRAAWAEALNGKDLLQFETTARAAFSGSAREAERLAQLTDATLREAVRRTGLEFEQLQGSAGAAARGAINDVDVLIRGLDSLKAQGVDTGRALAASLSNAIRNADTEAALDAIRGQIEQVRGALGDRVANGFLDEAAQKARELGDALDSATPGINSLREAMKELGVTTDDTLQRSAKKAQDAYDAIASSGKASQRELSDAFKSAAEAAIKAADGVAPQWVKLESAARGYRLEVDAAGDAHLRMGDKALTGAEKVEAAFRLMGVQTQQEMAEMADKYKDAYNTMLFSGQASADGLTQAFKNYAAAAITANGGVADDFLRAEAAQHGLVIAYDKTGKAVVKSCDEMGEAMERAMHRGNAAIEEQMGYLDRLEKRNEEVSKNSLLNQRDQNGFSTDANGKTIGATGYNWLSIYNMVKGLGVTDEQARGIADQAYNPDGSYNSGLQKAQKRNKYESIDVTEAARRAAEQIIRKTVSTDTADTGASNSTSSSPGKTGPAGGSGASSGAVSTYVSNITLAGKTTAVKFADRSSQQAAEELLRSLANDQRRAA